MKVLWPECVVRPVNGILEFRSGVWMNPCPFQLRVEAYHDGEIDAEERSAVEQHVATCPTCAADLAWMRGVSRSFATTPAGMTPAERGRLQDALKAAMAGEGQTGADADLEEGEEEAESDPVSLYRTAGVLSAIAASILLLSVVWLNELPSGTRKPVGGTAVAVGEVPAWERVAINLRADPLPNTPGGEVYLADARLADWMLQGLTPAPVQDLRESP
jgi:anti-sigma factor RsiW